MRKTSAEYMKKLKSINKYWLIPITLMLGLGVYYLPTVHSRLSWRLDELRTKIKFFFNPPEDTVFRPSGQTDLTIETVIATTRAEYALTLNQQATATQESGNTPTPTVTSIPLPASIILEDVQYEYQHGHLNYCGPANFSMALRFWGWDGNRDVIGKAIQPVEIDRNAMPYELQDFIAENVPGISSASRVGGDIETLKRFVTNGFPVVVEKGIYEVDINKNYSWMGHYAFVTGYDDANETIIYQDSYQPQGSEPGPNRKISYEKFVEDWRAFNYIFVVVYPIEKDAKVVKLLGNLANEETANLHALEIAKKEATILTGTDRYFAWFNMGTSYTALHQYIDAATAYDQAFVVYASLDGKQSLRPYRMIWYQTGPYFAYYYSNRFSDVIELASLTLKDRPTPDLEESLLWRGRAYYMTGKTNLAVTDYRAALQVHPNWLPAIQALQDLGLQP